MQYGPFFVWILAFLVAWLTLIHSQSLWHEVAEHWPIALAMLFGSYVAGSTPMGGGTVGFPILVLLFDQPASLGRNFSFCIQSVGMVSASIFILCRRRAVAFRMLAWTLITAAVVLPIGLTLVVPYVNDATVKLLFACIWGSFGIMTLVKLREMSKRTPALRASTTIDLMAGIAVGVIGGLSAALTGVGIDMALYTLLVLSYRVDIKTAVATSVIAMAITSLMGVVWSVLLGRLSQEVFLNWIAAAPVVLFGAPIGSLVVSYIRPTKTLIVVSLLCIGQLVWTIFDVGATFLAILGVLVALVGFQGVFHFLWQWGARRLQRAQPDNVAA